MELGIDQAVLLGPGEGETISDRAERNVKILVDLPQLVVTWTRYEAGERGPDPHVHRKHADGFYVLEGVIRFRLGPGAEHVVDAPAGSLVVAPPNVVHTFANDSGERALYLNFHAPNGGFADFLRGARDGREVEWDNWDPPEDGGRPVGDAIVTLPGDGERFDRGNRVITILGALPEISLMELEVGPGWEGVDPHQHGDHTDSFYVLDGEIDFVAGHAGAGAIVSAPPGVVHGVERPQVPARLLNIHSPDTGFMGRVRAQ